MYTSIFLRSFLWAALCVGVISPAVAQNEPSTPLLDDAQLSAKPTVRRLESALEAPDSVYKLALASDRGGYYSRFANPSHNNMPVLTLPEAMATLGNVQELSINFYTINDGFLPAVVGKLTHLQTLDLSKGTLQRLPEDIGNLQYLNSLTVSGNRLTTLPDAIGQLENLTTLDVSNNFLILLPSTIGGLTGLTSLNMSNNRAMALMVPQIGSLTALTELDASGCSLPRLPEELGNLTALTSLNLAENRLTEVPNSISRLTSLQSLDLSNNFLSTLPPDLGNLSGSLRELNLKGNFLSKADKARVRSMFPNTRVRL